MLVSVRSPRSGKESNADNYIEISVDTVLEELFHYCCLDFLQRKFLQAYA